MKALCSVDTSFYDNLSHHCICLSDEIMSCMYISLVNTGYTQNSNSGEMRGLLIAYSMYGNIPLYSNDNRDAISNFRNIVCRYGASVKRRSRKSKHIKICDKLSRMENIFPIGNIFIKKCRNTWNIVIFESVRNLSIFRYPLSMNLIDIINSINYTGFKISIANTKKDCARLPEVVKNIFNAVL